MIDNTDDMMFASLNKDYTFESCKKTVKLLETVGVSMRVSLVLGAPGGTRYSLKNNLSFAQSITKNPAIFVQANILQPFPHSHAYTYLIRKNGSKYRGKDIYSREEAEKDWIKHFTNVSYQ